MVHLPTDTGCVCTCMGAKAEVAASNQAWIHSSGEKWYELVLILTPIPRSWPASCGYAICWSAMGCGAVTGNTSPRSTAYQPGNTRKLRASARNLSGSTATLSFSSRYEASRKGRGMPDRPWVERRVQRAGQGGKPKTTLVVWMPYRGRSNEPWLRKSLGPRVHISKLTENGTTCWRVKPKYLWKVLRAMAGRYPTVDVRLQFSKFSRCDATCRDANPATVYDCVCSCNGTNHGGVDRWKVWVPSGRTTLVAYGEINEVQFVLHRDDLPTLIADVDDDELHHADDIQVEDFQPAPADDSSSAVDPVAGAPSKRFVAPPGSAHPGPSPARGPAAGPASLDSESEDDGPGCLLATTAVLALICTGLALFIHPVFWAGAVVFVVITLVAFSTA